MRLLKAAVCLFVVAALSLPFQPWSRTAKGAAHFEAVLSSDHAGIAVLGYDVGSGFNPADSAAAVVLPGVETQLRFALPSGPLVGLKIQILDRDCKMGIRSARIEDASGRVLRSFVSEDFKPRIQISSVHKQGDGVFVESDATALDPEITIEVGKPLVLPSRMWWLPLAGWFVFLLGAVSAVESWIGARRRRQEGVFEPVMAWCVSHPGGSILIAALLATVAANYPVVFAGKSLVSPNLNTALLYGQSPYVPGFQSVERGNASGADIDALMWDQVPFSMIEHSALLGAHELPLWNRYNSGGTSLLGQGQSCIGDPLQLIPLLANGAAWSWDFKFLLAKFLYSVGIGFCVWRLCAHLPAALALAFSAQFIGFFVYRVSHPAVFSFCYSPWILYAWLRILNAGDFPRTCLWIGMLIAADSIELASGTVKEAYILLLFLNFSGVCMLLASDRSAAQKLRLFSALTLGAVAFIMITAPEWYMFYRALVNSRTTYDSAQTYQLQPGMLAALFDEALYRPFQIFANVINPSANFFILIGLVAWIVPGWTPAAHRQGWALLVSTILPAVLAFGMIPPALVARVPFLGNILHVDNTFSCVLIVVFTVLAGVGWATAWDRLASPSGGSDSRRALGWVLALYLVYLGTAQAVVRTQYYQQTWGWLIKICLFLHFYGLSLILASALLLWALRRGRSSGWTSELVLLGLLAFAALHWRHGLHVGMDNSDYVLMPATRVNLTSPSSSIAAIQGDQLTPSRTIGFEDNFFPGWSAAYDLEGISGPDALMNKYYRELLTVTGMERVWDWRYRLRDEDLASIKPMLDLLNVRFYVDYPGGRRAERKVLVPFQSSDMEVYESPTAWPRAFFTDSAAVYSTVDQYWSWIRGGDGRPFAAIERNDWVQLNPLPVVSGDLKARRVQPASDYRLTPNSTTFTVSASGPGLIVLTEAFERKNFQAFVNGQKANYFRINHAFKGLYVPEAGTYTVTYRYWPDGLTISLRVAFAGLALTAVALALVFRTIRKNPGRVPSCFV